MEELLFILYKPLVHLLNYKAVTTKHNRKCHIFGKHKIFLVQLKNSTESKYNCVKTFDARHAAKHCGVSHGKCNFSPSVPF